ncbi:glycosyltransferase [bacterium]|nr:glycosyltransferase [bacterium]
MPKRFSLIIPTCNRPKGISRTIEFIMANTMKPFETIVVDQSDDDETEAIVKGLQGADMCIRYIRDRKKGLSRAKNIGIGSATGDILIFLDDDGYTGKDWLEEMARAFEDKRFDAGIVFGRVLPVYEEKNTSWEMPERWRYLLPAYDQGDRLERMAEDSLPGGGNTAIPREVFDRVGGYREELGVNFSKDAQLYGEDSEFALRVKKAGYDLVYNPGAILYHPVQMSRQNQGFLNRRLYAEGISQIYIHLAANRFSFISRARSLVTSLRVSCMFLIKALSMSRTEYSGETSFVKGVWAGCINYALLNKEM